MVNFYKLLEIEPTASQNEIKAAYKEAAKKCHPDKNGGTEQSHQDFLKIREAWDVLSDPKKRLEYDYANGFRLRPQPKQPLSNTPSSEFGWVWIITSVLLFFGIVALVSESKNNNKTK